MSDNRTSVAQLEDHRRPKQPPVQYVHKPLPWEANRSTPQVGDQVRRKPQDPNQIDNQIFEVVEVFDSGHKIRCTTWLDKRMQAHYFDITEVEVYPSILRQAIEQINKMRNRNKQ